MSREHPAEMSSEQWGESGVQDKTGLKSVACSIICKKAPTEMGETARERRRLDAAVLVTRMHT